MSGRSDSTVDLALSCMALAVYSQTQQHPAALAESAERFCRLLPMVQHRLSQVGNLPVDEANVDACLLAVFLLARYSSAAHDPSEPVSEGTFKSMQGWSHRDGSMALLKVWDDHLSHQPPSVIVRQTRRGLIRSSLLRSLPLPDWFLDGEKFGEHGLQLDYDRIAVRAVNLHARFATIQERDDGITPELEYLNAETQNLDEALQKWAAQVPSTCSYQQHFLEKRDNVPRNHFYSPTVYTYPKLGHAALWSQYFAARMLLNSKLLKILRLSRPDRPFLVFTYARQLQVCLAVLKEMGESLAANIPFALELITLESNGARGDQLSIKLNAKQDIKPYLADLVIWPLSIAACVEWVDDKLHQWFKSELGAVGRIVGDGIIQRAETDDWGTL